MIDEKKKEFEKRFFNGRPVEYLQSTKDMWDFIETIVREAYRTAVEGYHKHLHKTSEGAMPFPTDFDLMEYLQSLEDEELKK